MVCVRGWKNDWISWFDVAVVIVGQVIAFQNACLTKQNHSIELCMYQLGYISFYKSSSKTSWQATIKGVISKIMNGNSNYNFQFNSIQLYFNSLLSVFFITYSDKNECVYAGGGGDPWFFLCKF